MAKIDSGARYSEAAAVIDQVVDASNALYSSHTYSTGFLASQLAQVATVLTNKQFNAMMQDLRSIAIRLDERAKSNTEIA